MKLGLIGESSLSDLKSKKDIEKTIFLVEYFRTELTCEAFIG